MNKLFKQTNRAAASSLSPSIAKKASIKTLENHYLDTDYHSPEESKMGLKEGLTSQVFTPKTMTPKKKGNSDMATRTPELKGKSGSFDGIRETRFAEDDLNSCFGNYNGDLFITPQKPKKDLKTLRSRLLDTATTTTSTPINFLRSKFFLFEMPNF